MTFLSVEDICRDYYALYRLSVCFLHTPAETLTYRTEFRAFCSPNPDGYAQRQIYFTRRSKIQAKIEIGLRLD